MGVAQVPSKYTTIKEAMEHALAGKPYYMPGKQYLAQ